MQYFSEEDANSLTFTSSGLSNFFWPVREKRKLFTRSGFAARLQRMSKEQRYCIRFFLTQTFSPWNVYLETKRILQKGGAST